MKIFSAEQIKRGDAYTIMQEPISSVHLMERAAARCAQAVLEKYASQNTLLMLCGPGNNGGDGLVIARLVKPYFKDVHVFCLGNPENRSFDFIENYNKLQLTGIKPIALDTEDAWESFYACLQIQDIRIGDALFGTGLSKPILEDGYYSQVIDAINDSSARVFAVDIPSGLFADSNRHIDEKGYVLKAEHTFTFEQPKLSFLFSENEAFTGTVSLVPIGIHADFKAQNESNAFYLTHADAADLLKNSSTFQHKGSFGHALLVGGSKGKAGSIGLSAKACLATGAGLASVLVTEKVLPSVQAFVPEAMCISSGENNFIAQIPALPATISVLGIGPGLGTEKETVLVLKRFLAEKNLPFVLDADALNILSENKQWLSFLPQNTILTPHPKEFDRLTQNHETAFSRWQTQLDFSKRYQVYVVLKGAYTSITTPFGHTFFNSTGNPGMATAGSGDVLTGIITSLLAQAYTAIDAAVLGVYVHGLAGDIAYGKKGREALLASDIIDSLAPAFHQLHATKNKR